MRPENKTKINQSGQAIKYSSIVLIAASFALCAVFISRAWMEPNAAPPGGNIAAPLHTGTTSQTKQGSLNVSGAGGYGIYAQGTSYGVYGVNTSNGVSGLLGYAGYGGYFNGPTYTNSYSYSASYMQAPAYYDSANSNYGFVNRNVYADTINTGYSGDPLEINYYRQGDVKIGNGSAGGSNLYVYGNIYSSAAGVWMSQLCRADGTNCPGSSDTLQTVTNRGWGTSQPLYSSSYIQAAGSVYAGNFIYAGSYMQAPIFYDTNGSYYVDPNSTSRLNYGVFDNVYSIGWMQAPIYYDNQNTGYYVDPNGSSRLNQLYYVDSAYIVDLRPQYMYDWNDSNYYIDMNNGSRLNYLGRNYGWNWTEYDWNDTNYYMDLNNVSILNDLRVNILYDRQNTGYYVDPNYYSNVYAMQPVYSFNGPVYDWNNGGYYVDPNGGSQLSAVYANNWFRAQGNTGLYFQDYGGGWYMQDSTWIRAYNSKSIYTPGEMQATTVRANNQLCIGGDCRTAWPSGGTQVQLYSCPNHPEYQGFCNTNCFGQVSVTPTCYYSFPAYAEGQGTYCQWYQYSDQCLPLP